LKHHNQCYEKYLRATLSIKPSFYDTVTSVEELGNFMLSESID